MEKQAQIFVRKTGRGLPNKQSNQSPGDGQNIKSMKMMQKLMLSCKTATGLMEKKHTGEISFLEKMQLAFHTKMCDACRRYEEQSKLIERLFKSKENAPIPPELGKETKELEEKIILQLDSAQG